MIAWMRTHRRAAVDAYRRLVEGALGSLLTIVALGVVIALPAGGQWLLNNFSRIGDRVSYTHEISVYLRDEVSTQDIALVEQRIRDSGVARLRFVSREEALAALQEIEGFANVIAGLKSNPLPDAFIVQPQNTDADSLTRWAALARGWPQVVEVSLDSAWAQRYDALLDAGRYLVNGLAVLLALALIAVTFNTVRLQIAGRQAEIEVALLLGATPGWIARPFLWLGLLEGFIGGLLAVLLLFVAYGLSGPVTTGLAALYGDALVLALPGSGLILSVLSGATLIGWLGARLSVWALMRQTH